MKPIGLGYHFLENAKIMVIQVFPAAYTNMGLFHVRMILIPVLFSGASQNNASADAGAGK